MGFPVKSLKDVIENRTLIEQTYSAKFYAFILYSPEQREFREFILNNFFDMDNNSPDLLFFLIDYPEDWFKHGRRSDHLNLYGSDYIPVLDLAEVEIVREMFQVKEFELPVVITFKSLNSYSGSVFSLASVQNNNWQLSNFFMRLFEPLEDNESYYDRSKSMQKKSSLPSKIIENPNRDRMYEVFTELLRIQDSITEEDIIKYPKLNFLKGNLEKIIEELLDLKQKYKQDIQILESLSDINNSETEMMLEELHKKMDDDIYKAQEQRPMTYKSKKIEEFFGNVPFFQKYFERESLNMIQSALNTEFIMEKFKIEDYDYSLCAIGFWKALEIELNIIIGDALRLHKNILANFPSKGTSIANDPLPIKGINFKSDIVEIDINKKKIVS